MAHPFHATAGTIPAMTRTRLAALLLAIAVAALAAACGGSDSSSESTTGEAAATTAPATPTKITFSYFWTATEYPLIPLVVAQDQGMFEKAGLDVEVIFPPDPASATKVLATGDSNLGLITTTDQVFATEGGLPVQAIGNYTTSNNWGLFTKPGDPATLDAIKGKRISGYGDSWTNAMLPFVLEQAGLTAKDVEVVTVDWDLPLLLAGKVDMSTNTTNYLRAGVLDETGEEPGVLLARDNGAPDVPVWVYAGNTQWMDENPEATRAFMQAIAEATQWAIDNPQEAVAAYEKAYPDNGASTKYNQAGWDDLVQYIPNADGALLVQTDDQWTQLADALKGIGELDEVAEPGAYYTNAYLPKG